MIVDDSSLIRMQLKYILKAEGFNVIEEARDGIEFLSKYKQRKNEIDFVTLDITMDKMDGLEALEKVIKYDPNSVIIMVSAMNGISVIKKALMSGAKDYIIKPLNKEKIKEKIVKTLYLLEMDNE